MFSISYEGNGRSSWDLIGIKGVVFEVAQPPGHENNRLLRGESQRERLMIRGTVAGAPMFGILCGEGSWIGV